MFIGPDLKGPLATVLVHQFQGKSLRALFWTARGQIAPHPIGTELKSGDMKLKTGSNVCARSTTRVPQDGVSTKRVGYYVLVRQSVFPLPTVDTIADSFRSSLHARVLSPSGWADGFRVWPQSRIRLTSENTESVFSYCLGVLDGILLNRFQSCICGSLLCNSPVQALFWKV